MEEEPDEEKKGWTEKFSSFSILGNRRFFMQCFIVRILVMFRPKP